MRGNKIGSDVLGKWLKRAKTGGRYRSRRGDWHVVFWDLNKPYPTIISEIVPMEDAPTSRHAVAIAMRRLKEKGRRGKLKSVGFVDR